jgi:serine/threonine-protein kinase
VADRIAKGPIPLDEALPIAKQIAEALEAAHEQGIIHRDLKPANIKVREDGTVKVLDFGLAKAMEPASAISPQLTASPTITTPVQMTGVGMILGTAAYMSPEQARGKPVDSGADIWAFGCLLYEMLTGRRAFLGDDVTECIVTVMTKEPDWTALPAVPPLVGTFLRQSLKKDPKQRLGDMRDMRLALEGVFEVSLPAAAAASSRRIVVLGVAAAAFVVGVVIAGAAFSRVGARVSAPTGVERVSVMTPGNRIVDVPGSPSRSLAISPDGTALVYVTDSRESQPRTLLALRSLATLDVRDLPGTTGALQPFFSPDGQWVAFFTDEGMLKKIALSGGNPITLADKINGSRWAFGVWLDDGTIVFGTTTLALRRVSADSGQMTDLTTLDAARGESSHRLPALVPSTRALLFTAVTDLSAAPRIEAVTLGTG